jgi:hypothetical protein
MALICRTFTTWITETVLDQVETWVDEQQEQCKQYPWWDPRGWFCWIETITVKVVIQSTKEIVVPFSRTICFVMAGILFFSLSPFAAAIDSVAPTWHVYFTLKKWLWTPRITFDGKQPTSIEGVYLYSFTCRCSGENEEPIAITASNDDEAALKAEEECAKVCDQQ